MTDSTTLTVRLSAEVKNQLGRLAEGTRRTKSFLASEAIEAYVKHEVEILEGIEQAFEDIKAGQLVPHDEAMRQIQDIIERASKK